MFVIRCPYCQEPREEEEFSYSGEAFIARPARPENVDDETWGDYLFKRKNPKGWHWEMWSHAAGCRKFLIVKRHTVSHAIAGTWNLVEGRNAFDAEGGLS